MIQYGRMNENDFDRAADFLQSALDAAVAQNAAPTPHGRNEACLPGFEEIVEKEAISADEQAVSADHSAADAASAGSTVTGGFKPDIGKLVLCVVCAICAGVAIVAAHKLIRPRVVMQEVIREVPVSETETVPIALLPDTADASLWPVIADMSGLIDGKPVFFKRGIAATSDGDYKVCLDFCRKDGAVFVRVQGNGAWVVKVSPEGKIEKAYRAPRGGKPLKELFAQP